MTVELRYCESCGVIIPVDLGRPGPERYTCEECRTVAGPETGSAGDAPTPRPASPVAERPELAATQPVQRRPRSQLHAAERPRERRARDPSLLVAAVVLLPILLGAAVLICTVREKGFAVRGTTGDRLEWFGKGAAHGTARLHRLVLGSPGADRIEEKVPGEGPFASSAPPDAPPEDPPPNGGEPAEADPDDDESPAEPGEREVDARPR
jgi:hypothetical protein